MYLEVTQELLCKCKKFLSKWPHDCLTGNRNITPCSRLDTKALFEMLNLRGRRSLSSPVPLPLLLNYRRLSPGAWRTKTQWLTLPGQHFLSHSPSPVTHVGPFPPFSLSNTMNKDLLILRGKKNYIS